MCCFPCFGSGFHAAHACWCCRFVSDYGPEGYDCVCQHRLLQALQRLNIGPEYVRTYPPCLLEWTANRKRAHTVLHLHCFDGEETIIVSVVYIFFYWYMKCKDKLVLGLWLFNFLFPLVKTMGMANWFNFSLLLLICLLIFYKLLFPNSTL